MGDYISRTMLIAGLFEENGAEHKYCVPCKDIMRIIENTPAADVVEVKHGHWEHTPTFWIYCSVCGREPNEYNERVNFCPYCGADMRETT